MRDKQAHCDFILLFLVNGSMQKSPFKIILNNAKVTVAASSEAMEGCNLSALDNAHW